MSYWRQKFGLKVNEQVSAAEIVRDKCSHFDIYSKYYFIYKQSSPSDFIYYLKCKKKTATTNEKMVSNPNVTKRLIGICSICGTNKSQATKSPTKAPSKTLKGGSITGINLIQKGLKMLVSRGPKGKGVYQIGVNGRYK